MRGIVVILGLVASGTAFADNKTFTGGTGQDVHHDCADTGEVSIEISSSRITLGGTCRKVWLGGSQNVVTIASTAELVVGGTENRVAVDTTDHITTLGNRNAVTYRRGVTRKLPKRSLLGKGNSARQIR